MVVEDGVVLVLLGVDGVVVVVVEEEDLVGLAPTMS